MGSPKGFAKSIDMIGNYFPYQNQLAMLLKDLLLGYLRIEQISFLWVFPLESFPILEKRISQIINALVLRHPLLPLHGTIDQEFTVGRLVSSN